MSILIKGMEMPRTCNDCGLRDSFDCWITDSYIEARFSKRNEDCPLVELPFAEELAEFLCSKMQICSLCEARDCCSVGHTGYIDWLKKEAEGSET